MEQNDYENIKNFDKQFYVDLSKNHLYILSAICSLLSSCESAMSITQKKANFFPRYLSYLTSEQFSGTSEEALRKSRTGVNMRERMLYSPGRRKEQRGTNPGDRVEE